MEECTSTELLQPSELEYLAECKQDVIITPRFNDERIHLMTCSVGPFNAGLPIKVPLWIAFYLVSRRLCEMQAPDWLNVEALETWKEQEQHSPYFQPMPCENYLEVARSVLTNAAQCVTRSDEVRNLIKDIWDCRMAKLRSSIHKFMAERETYAGLDNLSVMEINAVRPLLGSALRHLHFLRKETSQDKLSQFLKI